MKQARHQIQEFSTADNIGHLTVADTLSRWPQTTQIFINHRLACVGCSLSRFELLADVATVYNLDLEHFLQELRQVIESTISGSGKSDGDADRLRSGGKSGR